MVAKRNHIIGALDTGGIIALALTAAGLFSRPFSDNAAHSEHLLSLCLAGLCVAISALLLSRLIEITAHTIHQERIRGRRSGRDTKVRTGNALRDAHAIERDSHMASR